jgi:hypothetical protein
MHNGLRLPERTRDLVNRRNLHVGNALKRDLGWEQARVNTKNDVPFLAQLADNQRPKIAKVASNDN